MQKVLSITQLKPNLEYRKRIVFTHGAFDLFHVGHLELLKASKELGATLVVGVDADENIEFYKKRKPVMTQDHRVKVIAELRFVDFIIPIVLGHKELMHRRKFYISLYGEMRPDFVTYGSQFANPEELKNDCKIVGIKSQMMRHLYSDVTTTKIIEEAKTM